MRKRTYSLWKGILIPIIIGGMAYGSNTLLGSPITKRENPARIEQIVENSEDVSNSLIAKARSFVANEIRTTHTTPAEKNQKSNDYQKPKEKQTQKPVQIPTTDFSKYTDEDLLARLVFAEGLPCPKDEKIAIAYSVVNRTRDGLKYNGEGSLRSVIFKANEKGIHQYSCLNKNDKALLFFENPEEYNAEKFRECLDVAEGVLSGKYKDPTNGANLYCLETQLESDDTPYWAGKTDLVDKVNTPSYWLHGFFKEHKSRK